MLRRHFLSLYFYFILLLIFTWYEGAYGILCVCDINSYLLPKLNYFQLQNNSQLSLLYSFSFSLCVCFICFCFSVIAFVICCRHFRLSLFCSLYFIIYFSLNSQDGYRQCTVLLSSTGDRHSLKYPPMAHTKSHNKKKDRIVRHIGWNLPNFVCATNVLFILANFNGR